LRNDSQETLLYFIARTRSVWS